MNEKKFKWIWSFAILCLIMGCIFLMTKQNKKNTMVYDVNGKEIASIDGKFAVKSDKFFMDDIIIDSLLRELKSEMKNKKIQQMDYKELMNSGWKIYTSIDLQIQSKISDYYSKMENFFYDNRGIENYPQSSMIIMTKEGAITAMAGGIKGNITVNRVVNETYPVGSTIKPVSIYAPAIANQLAHYSSLCSDLPTNVVVNGKNKEWPQNADGKYEGQVTIEYALAKSKNTVPVNFGKIMGEENIYNYLKKNFFPTLVDNEEQSDKQLAALALGYFAKGISLDKLVAAYEPFVNEGKYQSPYICCRIIDASGDVIFERKKEEKNIMSASDAYIMTRLLINNVCSEDGIARDAKIEGIDVGGKTGTVANEIEDLRKLFVGVTPEYIGGVQVGYDDKKKPINVEVKPPITIWREIVEQLPHNESKFSLNENIKEMEFCTKTGNLKGDFCLEVKIGYYDENNMPEVCEECGS